MYAEDGIYTFGLGITDMDGTSGAGTGTANVADAPLSPISSPSIPFSAGVLLNNVVLGSFSDGNPDGQTTDFTATINWGDGSSPSTATVSGTPGDFTVTGSHTYAVGGVFTISDQIVDNGGSTLDLLSTANGVPEPGSLGMILAGLGSLSLLAWRRR